MNDDYDYDYDENHHHSIYLFLFWKKIVQKALNFVLKIFLSFYYIQCKEVDDSQILARIYVPKRCLTFP